MKGLGNKAKHGATKEIVGGIIILSFLWTATPQAQDMPVPVNAQFPLFLKILAFDRQLKTRVGDELVIAIIYQRKFRPSLDAKEEMVKAIEESTIKKIDDIPIRKVTIDIGEEHDLAAAVSRDRIDIFYVTPLRAVAMESFTSISRSKRISTLTGLPEYVESGLAVGIGTKGERPLIIINSPAAKAEGIDFNSQLLKLAKIIN